MLDPNENAGNTNVHSFFEVNAHYYLDALYIVTSWILWMIEGSLYEYLTKIFENFIRVP